MWPQNIMAKLVQPEVMLTKKNVFNQLIIEPYIGTGAKRTARLSI